MGDGLVASLRKLVRRFLLDPPEVEFSDVQRLLRAFGFSHRRGKGSHHFFWRGDLRISVPLVHGRKVKRTYARRLVRLLKLEDWDEAQEEIGLDAREGP